MDSHLQKNVSSTFTKKILGYQKTIFKKHIIQNNLMN